ncbi:MAG: hypothetical protein ACOC8H_02190 [bacterium]
MRNVFDQYSQPENRLTHAFASILQNDRKLIRPFLKRFVANDVPRLKGLRITEQQVPGESAPLDEDEAQGRPDACIYTDEGWATVFECKIQAGFNAKQLRRHCSTAQRYGFENPYLVVVAVDQPQAKLPAGTITLRWRDIYAWFSGRALRSPWARMFVNYMHVFESKMLAREYDVRGTLTMFDGVRFDEDNPYTYREGKRLLRLLTDELRQRKALIQKIGIDPEGAGRGAITGRRQDRVWDFIPLRVARTAASHTCYPHLTLGITNADVIAAVTIPNSIRGGFRTRLRKLGIAGFGRLIGDVEKRLRPVLRRSKGAKPMLYLHQRHFKSQASPGITDGRLDVDLRCLTEGVPRGPKRQPKWLEAAYDVYTHKRSNIQMGVEVHFPHTCPVVRSRSLTKLFEDTWLASNPMLSFALGRD